MKFKYRLFFLLNLIFFSACNSSNSVIKQHVTIRVDPYEENGEMNASAMPVIPAESILFPYYMRFEYLLMNISEMHQFDKIDERQKIWALYPDTLKLKKAYLDKFVKDEKLGKYFFETAKPILEPNSKINTSFNVNELMDVASRFFYCDAILPDTSIQAHVCIGLNGTKEANWTKDYTLLEAFCYEAIFNDFEKDTSLVWESFGAIKDESAEKYRTELVSLDEYLQKVKLDVFEKMKNDELLKSVLLDYYKRNENNLAFNLKTN